MVRLLTVLMMMMPFLAGMALAQDGKVYKIVNPDGSVSYSDRPPSGKGSSARELELGPGSSGIRPITPEEVEEANARSKARLEEMERERQQAAQRAREEERAAEKPPEESMSLSQGIPVCTPARVPAPCPLTAASSPARIPRAAAIRPSHLLRTCGNSQSP